jgi:hypothetical protein
MVLGAAVNLEPARHAADDMVSTTPLVKMSTCLGEFDMEGFLGMQNIERQGW